MKRRLFKSGSWLALLLVMSTLPAQVGRMPGLGREESAPTAASGRVIWGIVGGLSAAGVITGWRMRRRVGK